MECQCVCAGAPAYRKTFLQPAGKRAEAVQHQVLTHTVDPLALRRQRAAHKVPAFCLPRAKTPHNLEGGMGGRSRGMGEGRKR